nr:MAG TPA: hypothetical protein [Caudoviricetes sp.]
MRLLESGKHNFFKKCNFEKLCKYKNINIWGKLVNFNYTLK